MSATLPHATPQALPQAITGFHRDDEGDWVADLACGHGQHVRHHPPWFNRPWVVTEAGRLAALGQILQCRRCVEEADPDPAPASCGSPADPA